MKQQQNSRARAAIIIEKWEKSRCPLARLMDDELQLHPFNKPVDSQLFRAIVYGVVRWKGYLDYILEQYSRHPFNKMDLEAKQVLRIALYQMFFMDRIPLSAAINESVKILKQKGRPRWLTGFVNGLLRTIDRESDRLPAAGGDTGYPRHVLHSYPEWLYSRWEKRYGEERASAICRAGNKPAPLCLRAKMRGQLIAVLEGAGIKAIRGQYSPQAVVLPDFRGRVENLPGYAEGLFQVQDQAAQLAAYLVGLKKPVRCLDGCAGLGGKTTHLAELLPGGSKVFAVEPDQRRSELLRRNLQRLQLAGKVEIISGRLQDIESTGAGFEVILVDAPCSGLGVIRHHPDIRWNRKEEDLGRYREAQLELLACAAELLVPGGVMVYATCSTEPEENEAVVDEFVAGHSGFAVDDCRMFLPDQAHELVDANGFFHPLPDQGLDGFFAVRLHKNNPQSKM